MVNNSLLSKDHSPNLAYQKALSLSAAEHLGKYSEPNAADALNIYYHYETSTRGKGRAPLCIFCAFVFAIFAQAKLDAGVIWEKSGKYTKIQLDNASQSEKSPEYKRLMLFLKISWLSFLQ